MKKYALLVALFIFPGGSLAATFSDIPETHPSYAAVESLKNLSVINGFSDGTFQPKNSVTRAESLKMILISAGINMEEEEVPNPNFSDVSEGAWFFPFVAKAKQMQMVKGYGDSGKFAPNNQVTKAEFLKILFSAFEKDLSKHNALKSGVSADTSATDWYISYMSYAKTMGIIHPDTNSNLFPNKPLSRGDCADIIYNLLVIERGGEEQKMLSIAESHLVDLLVNLNNGNITSALHNAEQAVYFSEQALSLSPDEPVVRAAEKIARGFQELSWGYKAGLEKKYDEVRAHAQKAKDFAGNAFDESNSTQSVGKNIKQQADLLLGQIPEGK